MNDYLNMSNHWQTVSWDSALSLCTFWSVSIISTCFIPPWRRNSMAALCWRRTSILEVVTLAPTHFKNPFCVLKSVSEGLILWKSNKLWRHLCVLVNFIHYLLNDPSSGVSEWFQHILVLNAKFQVILLICLLACLSLNISKYVYMYMFSLSRLGVKHPQRCGGSRSSGLIQESISQDDDWPAVGNSILPIC